MKIPDFPMPITTDRLIIRPAEASDAKMINDAILESYDALHQFMEWADHIPIRCTHLYCANNHPSY